MPTTTEGERRVCATPGCKTRIRATNESLVCDPCRATNAARAAEVEAQAQGERERAEEAAQAGSVPCRQLDCPYPATHGVGSKSPRWRDLCDQHYQEQLDTAQRAANETVERRVAGELGPPKNGKHAREDRRKGEEAQVRADEIPGLRSKLVARMAVLAGQLDVIDAEMAILREQARPLEDEMAQVMEELTNAGRAK